MKRITPLSLGVILITFVNLTSCTYYMKNPFDPPDRLAWFLKKGEGSISGQAFMRRMDGIVIYAAGSRVYLYPNTAYFSELAECHNRNISNWRIKGVENGPQNYCKDTQANGEGRFHFDNLPAGDYIIETEVQWGSSSVGIQGGQLWGTVIVQNGTSSEIILTQ